MVHAVAGRILGRPHRARCAGNHHGVRRQPLHAGRTGRSARRRDPRGAAHAAGAESEHRPDRLDVQLDPGSVAVRSSSERGRSRARHVPGRPDRIAARRGPARSQHADAGPAAAELPARARDERSGGPRRHGSHRVPPETHGRPASHRRVEGGARGIRLADASVAGRQGGCGRHGTGQGTGRVRDVALGHLLGVRLPVSPSCRTPARSAWTSTRSPSIPESSSTRSS